MFTGPETRNRQLAALLLAAAGAYALYLATLSQSVGWHDGPELALTAWLPGASHAPGSPVHSLVGYVYAHVAEQAYAGTNQLSAQAAALAAGLLACLAYVFCGSLLVAVAAGLVYALSYQVWGAAVITEVYSLGMLLLALAIWFATRWRVRRRRSDLVLMQLFYVAAMGAYFANVLLWPAFAGLLYFASGRTWRLPIIFGAVSAAGVVLIAWANYLLAAHALPFGEVMPDSFPNMFAYMSGAQHEPLDVDRATTLFTRLPEHVLIFAKSLAYLGLPLGLVGVWAATGIDRMLTGFMATVFAIYIGYYTVFGPGDYFQMVLPAYFVFVVWIAVGCRWLMRRLVPAYPAPATAGVLALIAGVLLVVQYEGRRMEAADMSPEAFVAEAFDALPPNAVAVTGWRQLTPLTYFQYIEARRPDIRFLVPARAQRHYRFGVVEDYLLFLDAEICRAPVYTSKPLADLAAHYEIVGASTDRWKQIRLVEGQRAIACTEG
jgi:hypothetical protein